MYILMFIPTVYIHTLYIARVLYLNLNVCT